MMKFSKLFNNNAIPDFVSQPKEQTKNVKKHSARKRLKECIYVGCHNLAVDTRRCWFHENRVKHG